jgi:hypothetical protein
MNLFPKYYSPSMYLLLENPFHLIFGHVLVLAIITCLRHHTYVTWIRDWSPSSNSRPLILQFVIFVMPLHLHSCENWYSVHLNPPCNKSLATWRFMGHTTLASSSFILPCGNYLSNVMLLAPLNCVLLFGGRHLNNKGGDIEWLHSIHDYIPELNKL